MPPFISTVSTSFNAYKKKVTRGNNPLGVDSYEGFISSASSGSNISLAGESGTSRSVPVVTAPDGNKSVRFSVTWPGSTYSSINQNQTQTFSMGAADFTIFSDIDYIFNGGFIGVGQISGASEACCDKYSMTFSGIELFNLGGSITSQFYKVAFSGSASSNSGVVKYTTDGSVNGGNGLTGGSGFIYLL